MSAGARFIRGFQRVGIVVAGLVGIVGVITTIVIAIDQQSSADGRYRQAKCVYDKLSAGQPVKMREYDKSKIDYDGSGCFGPGYGGTPAEVAIAAANAPAPMEFFLGPFFIGLGTTTVCSALSFGLFWLLGWLCAGFTRD
ncbi:MULTISPECIES: hypothetical protein [Bradyrhizobium]|uniref:hypothetical protein n=1 Tax=Bradyrhizobium TaxID=374 RepID=UPI0004818DA1|nr:hypothetical protein [Bradyrhizobium japonicum]MCP1766068.1 putative membrane protein YedE/YeeE [Bradyrhizobium japonicum]MCP1788205.1 putative membrane protein YedE/YeeE [Bradyrhizobium japonicum]MCP1810081.1 putative membrane protein YedE/YeeE [Bradyrhizobium japonicum]MCP1819015.1 putative membrane protein YedE/YeeE [Bradyrhizobium japonicum]MCP1869475.1 putative membrane protein YedE/YeeE [Bradyrhizobium japonicum]